MNAIAGIVFFRCPGADARAAAPAPMVCDRDAHHLSAHTILKLMHWLSVKCAGCCCLALGGVGRRTGAVQGRKFKSYLDSTKVYGCASCGVHLSSKELVMSKVMWRVPHVAMCGEMAPSPLGRPPSVDFNLSRKRTVSGLFVPRAWWWTWRWPGVSRPNGSSLSIYRCVSGRRGCDAVGGCRRGSRLLLDTSY